MLQAKTGMVTALYRRSHRLILDNTQPNGSSSSKTNGTRTSTSFTNEASFDTNMVIILAALLCALICALGLNSIMRCALRCGRRFGFDARDSITAACLAATGKGLKKSALSRIPVTVYSDSGMNYIKATDCPICLGEFIDGEKVRVLPKCNHGFHVKCIDTWLMSHSSCPTCRRSLLDQAASRDGAPDIEDGIRQHGNSSGGQTDVPVAADEVG